jgi:hypothetical protein
MPKIIEQKIIQEFMEREYFSREELLSFFHKFEPDLKEGTFAWRIYDLKKKKIIRSLKKDLYTISYKPVYVPKISPDLFKLAKLITTKFDEIKHCLWETSWLNDFSNHQAGKNMMIIEIEKEFTESLFYELKDASKEVFLNPDTKTLDLYIAEINNPIIIKSLVSRSPIAGQTENKVPFNVPLLEKILVDIFAEEKLFAYLQGSELIHIFESALSSYAINFTRLFNYAKRRERGETIKLFMANNIFHLVNDFIDD